MKVFVTGGTGFLGRQVVRELLEAGHEVRCLVRSATGSDDIFETSPAGARQRLQFVRGSLGTLQSEYISGCDAICHAAASLMGCTSALFMDNVVGTRRLLAVSQSAAIRRFVLVSSLAVYGTADLLPGSLLDEQCRLDCLPHRRDPYTYSKVVQEQVVWEAWSANRCPLVVIRPGVIYGPSRDPLTNRVGLQFGPVLLRMGSRHLLPYVQLNACARGISLAVETPGIEGEAFNLLDEGLLTAREFLKYYRKRRTALRVVPVPRWAVGYMSRLNEWYSTRSNGQLPALLTPYKSASTWKSLQYSISKAKTVLNWVPQSSTKDGLLELLNS